MEAEIIEIIKELTLKTKTNIIMWMPDGEGNYHAIIGDIKIYLYNKWNGLYPYYKLSVMNLANTVFYNKNIGLLQSFMLSYRIEKQEGYYKKKSSIQQAEDELPVIQRTLETIKAL